MQTFPQGKTYKMGDTFDIFIFNNVKSDYKTMFCLQNKKEYEIKILPL